MRVATCNTKPALSKGHPWQGQALGPGPANHQKPDRGLVAPKTRDVSLLLRPPARWRRGSPLCLAEKPAILTLSGPGPQSGGVAHPFCQRGKVTILPISTPVATGALSVQIPRHRHSAPSRLRRLRLARRFWQKPEKISFLAASKSSLSRKRLTSSRSCSVLNLGGSNIAFV